MKDVYKKRKIKLKDFFRENKRVPSYSEMMGLFGLKSKNTIFYLVQKFIKDGLLNKDKTGKLTPFKLGADVKILGTVEAGFPSPAEEELVDTISIDEYLISNKEATFLLKVSGESMIDAGIMPGDLVLVEKGKEANQGDIVVAEVDNEWTIKRFVKENGRIVLMPENKKFKPIYPRENLTIAGVIISTIRKYH
ncbi:transcriptional repressor LexA [Patescibacteria group bacterium]|nr:transcriptional repressor LexA [Patescibacteria group bacterium]